MTSLPKSFVITVLFCSTQINANVIKKINTYSIDSTVTPDRKKRGREADAL
jgi:hypothetical protein